MAKRIVCCPVVGDSGEQKLEYLYVDTSRLLVKNVTSELGAFLDDVQGKCCFDAFSDYVLGEKVLSDEHKKALPFKLVEINSFELFKSPEELRFKTGSEKILNSCLLNYYRREYDETQQHTFFSEPGVSNTYVSMHNGVEHELTIEDRTWVKKKKEEVELETLDKGKSDAEREAEAELARAELAQAEALAEAEAAALKQDKKDAKRKRHNRLMEDEQYREFRNQDDVKNAQFQRLREYEEEMRRNNDALAGEYDEGNYNSLPGWVPENEFSDLYEDDAFETVGIPVRNTDLYGLASRMDEFGVPYTVVSESFNDGTKHSVLCYSSVYAETGELARDFYELEQALQSDNVVDRGVFYSAFQLSALDYAYANNVDVFYVRNGEFNGNQMYRVVDAGLNGYDMAVLADSSYTPAHMDALTHYMSFGWNTNQISDPSLAPDVLADTIMREEHAHGISRDYTFFEKYDYDSFLSYKDSGYVTQFNNEYDAKVQDYYRHNEQQAREAASREAFDEFKENLHVGYEERQREMNYLPTEGGSFGVPYDSDYSIPGGSADFKQDYVSGGGNVGGGHNHDTFKDGGVIGSAVTAGVPPVGSDNGSSFREGSRFDNDKPGKDMHKPDDYKTPFSSNEGSVSRGSTQNGRVEDSKPFTPVPGFVDKGNGVGPVSSNDRRYDGGVRGVETKGVSHPVESRSPSGEQHSDKFGVDMRPESLKGSFGKTQDDSSVLSRHAEKTGFKGAGTPSGGFRDDGHKSDVKAGFVPTEHVRDGGVRSESSVSGGKDVGFGKQPSGNLKGDEPKGSSRFVDSRILTDKQHNNKFGVEMRPESLKGNYGKTRDDSPGFSGQVEKTGVKGAGAPAGGFNNDVRKMDVKGGSKPTERVHNVETSPVKANIGNKNVGVNKQPAINSKGNISKDSVYPVDSRGLSNQQRKDGVNLGVDAKLSNLKGSKISTDTSSKVPGGSAVGPGNGKVPASASGLSALGSSLSHKENRNGFVKPYSFNASYTPTGRTRSDASFVPYSSKGKKVVSTGAKVLAAGAVAGAVGTEVAAGVGKKKVDTVVNGVDKAVAGVSKVADGTSKVINSRANKGEALKELGANKTPKETVKQEVLKQDGKKTPKNEEVVHRKKNSSNSGGSGSGFGGKKAQTGTPTGGGASSKRSYPLNDLKVRSDFAQKMGLRVRNYGSGILSSGSRFVRMSASDAIRKIANNDETGTVMAYNKIIRTGGNILYSAQLVMDIPRNFVRVGQGISYTGNAIANIGREATGKAPVKKSFKPLSSKAYAQEIQKLQKEQVSEIKKKFGAKAVKMDVRTIDSHIKKLTKEVSLITQKQEVLRKEIGELYKKKRSVGLNKAEALKLKEKLKLFNKNNELLHKNKLKIKKLTNLKNLKKAHEKVLGDLQAKHGRHQKKDGRLRNLPRMLASSFVSQLNNAGNETTMSGLAAASGYAMSIARNPITRGVSALSNRLIFKPATKVAKKVGKKAAVATGKAAIKAGRAVGSAVSKTKLAKKTKTTVRAAKTGVKNAVEKKVGKKTVNSVKNTAKKAKNTAKKTAEGAKKVGSAVAKPFKAISNAFGKVSSFFSGVKAAILKYLLIAVAALLLVMMLVEIVGVVGGAISSFIFAGDESDDGRINLTYYVNKIEGFQQDLQDEITNIENQTSSTGQEYDNVFYDYNGPAGGNTKQILAMAYVRFDMDIDRHRSDVVDYMEQLYKDSNFVDYAESAPYKCDNGCEEREYKCYDPIDVFATETRKTQFLSSNHGVHGKGCVKSANYSCMEKGHLIYNKYGCSRHNSGLPMTSKGSCTNYTTKVIPTAQADGSFKNVTYYYCQGHCNKSHYDYSCPGHTEMICRGKHVDVTITITSLDFDEIFAADSSVAQTGSTVKGEAYEDKFIITGYCPCVVCCGKSDGITASGVKAKANHTIAVDTSVIPMGTHVWIDGREYVAEDTGSAIKGNRIDMYFDSHAEASRWGVRTKTVYTSEAVEEGIEATKDKYGFTGWTEENIEIVKNVFAGLTGDDCNEIYKGLEDITDLSYGYSSSEPIDFDFSSIVYEDGTLTAKQQKILDVIESNTVATRAGYCQAWVARVYQAALGGAVQSRCCANHAGQAWGASDDWGSIQVGASVYGYGRSKYGHVGIYIGGGMVAHNIGYVKVESLESWVKTYNGRCWGWNGGANLTGNSKYNCKAAGTYMVGKD